MQSIAAVNTMHPVNKQCGLNRDLLFWWLGLPGKAGGNTVYDITRRWKGDLIRAGSDDADWEVTPRRDYGIDFVPASGFGGGRLLFPSTAAMYPGDNMTVSLWTRPMSASISKNVYVVSQYDYAGANRQWAVVTRNATPDSWAIITSSDGTNSAIHGTSTALALGWHHVAFVVDNANKKWRFFYDGQYMEEVTATYSYADQGSFLTIGGLDADTFSFYGKLADVRIWRRRLQDWEVGAVYRDSLAGWTRTLNRRRVPVARIAAGAGVPYWVLSPRSQIIGGGVAA